MGSGSGGFGGRYPQFFTQTLHGLQFGAGRGGCGGSRSGRRRCGRRRRNGAGNRGGGGRGATAAEGFRRRGGYERTTIDHATAIGAVFGVHRDGTTAFLTGIHFHRWGVGCRDGEEGALGGGDVPLHTLKKGRDIGQRPRANANFSRRKVSHFFVDLRRLSHMVSKKTSFFRTNATLFPLNGYKFTGGQGLWTQPHGNTPSKKKRGGK